MRSRKRSPIPNRPCGLAADAVLERPRRSERARIWAHAVFFANKKCGKKAVFGALPGLNLGTKNGPKIETATIGVSKNGAGKRPQTVNTKTTFWNPVGAQPGADLRVPRVLQGTCKVGTETAAAVASMEL